MAKHDSAFMEIVTITRLFIPVDADGEVFQDITESLRKTGQVSVHKPKSCRKGGRNAKPKA